MKEFLLHSFLLGMAQGLSTTQIVPFAKEESKKRGLLHRHLQECQCKNGGGRNLNEAAIRLFERGLSGKSVQELIDGLSLTLRSNSTTGEVTIVNTEPPIVTPNEQELAMTVANILENTVGDLEDLTVYTATYQNANKVVNQDATGIINTIFDFIRDLIQLVISVIEQIVSLIVDIIVGIINIIVGVIVAIFQFIESVIRAILNFIPGIFNADFDADKFSFLGAAAYPPEADDIPALKTIYDGLLFGTQAIGLGNILQLVSTGGEALNGVLGTGLTTAPLVMMEFVGVNTTNSILCALGATETANGACPTMSQDAAVCAACAAAAEMVTSP